jgi:molybdenum cofactor cytidylyltransferase
VKTTSQEGCVAGVILAAGSSKRFGEPKQLLKWQGEPFITHIARNVLSVGLGPLILVTGAETKKIEAAVNDLPVKIVYNPDWAQGQSTSMKAGLDALPEGCQAVMFLLGDQPQIPVELLRQLIERYEKHRAPITAPKVGERRGNPVLFSREAFPELQGVTGDQGGRAIFDQFEVDWLPWNDEHILLDVDDEADLEVLRRAYGEQR